MLRRDVKPLLEEMCCQRIAQDFQLVERVSSESAAVPVAQVTGGKNAIIAFSLPNIASLKQTSSAFSLFPSSPLSAL